MKHREKRMGKKKKMGTGAFATLRAIVTPRNHYCSSVIPRKPGKREREKEKKKNRRTDRHLFARHKNDLYLRGGREKKGKRRDRD